MLTLLYDLIPRLTILLALRREDGDSALGTPPAELLPGYLAAIEQALAVGLAARMPAAESFLHQERAIFDHLFDVALHGAELLRPRMLLVNALENESRRRPDIVREYLEKLTLLQAAACVARGPGRRSRGEGRGDRDGEGERGLECALNGAASAKMMRRLPAGVEFLIVVTWAFGLPIFSSIMSIGPAGSSRPVQQSRAAARH